MWPDTLRPRRRLFTAGVCLLLFLLGIPMTTQGGAFIFQLMDFYSASGIPILWCCFFQTISIGWIFGTKRFAGCVEQMTGFRPNFYWIATWGFVAPVVMASIFIFYLFRWSPVKYGDIQYPLSAHVIGFVMSLMSMLWIPGYAIYYMLNQRGNLKDRLIKGLMPNIKSNRIKAPAKNMSERELQFYESSARLLKNSSFVTPNASFNIQPVP
ncbi:SLC6A1 [Lepeophtheirus salmonis]|nr:SLC6A1 [Lepeophtheirus salmonis]CAF2829881.1 SLC6A1 [Lepeophtheirus salmonis]